MLRPADRSNTTNLQKLRHGSAATARFRPEKSDFDMADRPNLPIKTTIVVFSQPLFRIRANRANWQGAKGTYAPSGSFPGGFRPPQMSQFISTFVVCSAQITNQTFPASAPFEFPWSLVNTRCAVHVHSRSPRLRPAAAAILRSGWAANPLIVENEFLCSPLFDFAGD